MIPRTEDVKKILVVRFGAFGDVLMTFPLLEALRQTFPAAAVDYAVFDVYRPLLEAAPLQPRKVIVLRRSAWKKMSPLRRFLDQLSYVRQVRREKYDLLLDPLSNTRSFFLALFSGARYRLGIYHRGRTLAYHRTMREGERKYAAEVNLDLLRELGFETPLRLPAVNVPAEYWEYGRRFFEREGLAGKEVVLLHPTGSWPSKVWPAEHFAAVARGLAPRPVLVLWGPGEKEEAQRVADMAGGPCRLLPETSILQALGIIAGCSLMVSNDTGPRHMAQALGVPTVCIYGPTWRECWGPGGEKNVEIQKEVPCGPCDKTECDDMRCLRDVGPDEVLSHAAALLAKFGPGKD